MPLFLISLIELTDTDDSFVTNWSEILKYLPTMSSRSRTDS